MNCSHCNKELAEDSPHVKEQHFEHGNYRHTRYFCNIECQVLKVLKGRWGYSEYDAMNIFYNRAQK